MIVETLLENMSGKMNYVGKPVKSIGYYSHKTNKKSQSIAIYTNNFVGRVIIEASLKYSPSLDNDWFPISLDNDLPYLEYNNFDYVRGAVNRKNNVYTIVGNYVWLRAKLDRNYLSNIKTTIPPYDLHQSNYVITGHSNMDIITSPMVYKNSPLNPKDDPEYYEGWTPSFTNSSDRQLAKSHLGNVEKILLCY